MSVEICPASGKTMHRTRAAVRASFTRRAMRPGTEPYNCPHCGTWHATSARQKPKGNR